MKKRDRALALIIAVLFFATSVVFSAVVIWQMANEDDQTDTNQDTQALLQDSQTEQLQEAQQNEQPQEDQLEGTKLADFTPLEKVEKLQSIDRKEGDGAAAQPGSTITAHYTGALAKDGTIFQSSHDGPNQPFTATLDQVIKGWQEGIPGMKAGGTRRLIIPAELAYGDQSPSPNIPPNSDLVFDIELISVE